MIDEIPKYPSVPEALRDAASLKLLVPFVGAGVSRIGGYPDWAGLAEGTIAYFIKQQKFDHGQLNQIADLPPRLKLSLAADLELEHRLKIDFRKILTPDQNKKEARRQIYDHVHRLWMFSDLFLTTNYDEELDSLAPPTLMSESDSTHDRSTITPNVIDAAQDITVNLLDHKRTVVHIHGSVRARDSMVLTTLDYLERYQGNRHEEGNYIENKFLTFLDQLFHTRNVLFIGYGLDELEILEYVIQKGLKKRRLEKGGARHFVLQGFFSHQLNLARSLDGYFRSFGIQLLPFSRDERDWESLIGVLAKLSEELPPGSRLPSSERLDMENLLA
tara:strand:+ start:1072 stop:2064 length:993 start_codon:yes stop_codon:yes gene_type:complete